jgi:lysophospholipase L1-like esterase
MPLLSNHLLKDIKFYNLYPNFDKIFSKENYLDYSWALDGHFNDLGYEVFARELYQEWKK